MKGVINDHPLREIGYGLFSVGKQSDVKKNEHHKVKMAFHVKSGTNLPLLKLLVINLPAALYCTVE